MDRQIAHSAVHMNVEAAVEATRSLTRSHAPIDVDLDEWNRKCTVAIACLEAAAAIVGARPDCIPCLRPARIEPPTAAPSRHDA